MNQYDIGCREVLESDIESVAKYYRAERYTNEALRRRARRALTEDSPFASGVCSAAAARVLRERSTSPNVQQWIHPLVRLAPGVTP